MKKSTLRASVLSIPLLSLAIALPATPAVAAPLAQGAEVVMAHAVNDLGGVLDIAVVETPGENMPLGSFSYVSAQGYAYGGTLDTVYVDGDRAYVTGEVTYSTGPPVGWGIGFWVDDNGTPGSGAQDDHSYFLFRPAGPFPGLANIQGFREVLDTAPTTAVVSGDIMIQG